MAFQTAAGYGNLPNGNFSPTIFSKKAQLAFRKSTVVEAVTNSDYFGEISGYGDTVEIIKEPEITIEAHARGETVTPQNLDDEAFQLTIDKAFRFSFAVDDIEKAHSHIEWMNLASNRAAYKMKDQHDSEVLGYLSGYSQSTIGAPADTVNTTVSGTKAVSTAGSDELLTSMKLNKGSFGNITTASAGDHSIPLTQRLPGATSLPTAVASPHMVVSKMALKLNKQNVDTAGRWLVISPEILELLQDEDSRWLNVDFGEAGALRNGLIMNNWLGFRVYISNNLPAVGTGPGTSGSANQNTDYGVIVAGHDSAVATASSLDKTESFRSQTGFSDVVRGLHVYGRKILRPEAIVTAKYNIA